MWAAPPDVTRLLLYRKRGVFVKFLLSLSIISKNFLVTVKADFSSVNPIMPPRTDCSPQQLYTEDEYKIKSYRDGKSGKKIITLEKDRGHL